jgi:hypothetical protein
MVEGTSEVWLVLILLEALAISVSSITIFYSAVCESKKVPCSNCGSFGDPDSFCIVCEFHVSSNVSKADYQDWLIRARLLVHLESLEIGINEQ